MKETGPAVCHGWKGIERAEHHLMLDTELSESNRPVLSVDGLESCVRVGARRTPAPAGPPAQRPSVLHSSMPSTLTFLTG